MSLGRPRNQETTDRILKGALEQLLTGGFEALNVESLAASAETSRTAIYRRWPNRTELAMAVIGLIVEVGEPTLAHSVAENLAHHTMQNDHNQRLNGLVKTTQGAWSTILSPQISTLYMERIGQHRRENGRAIIAQGIKNGELPANVNGDLILDTMAGLTLFRNAVAGRGLDPAEALELAQVLCKNPPLRKTK